MQGASHYHTFARKKRVEVPSFMRTANPLETQIGTFKPIPVI